jgi:hypothetical protein
MSKVTTPLRLLEAQVKHLERECAERIHECAHRVELLEGLPGVFAGLIAIAPAKERAALSRAIFFVDHELDPTAHNLRAVLICCLVLFDRYTGTERGVS